MNNALESSDFCLPIEHIRAIGETLADLAPSSIRAMRALCALKPFVEDNAAENELALFNALARDVISVCSGIDHIWENHVALLAALLTDDPATDAQRKTRPQ